MMQPRTHATCRWRSLLRLVGRGVAASRGVAAIEFAVVAPVLIAMAIGMVDLGYGVYRSMQVQNAAQAGAQYAVAHGFNATAIASAITSATGYSDISASPTPSQFCGCPTSVAVSTATCNSACADGTLAGTYVTASAQATYATLLPYPLLPSSFALASQSTVRIQ
jgi:Flp pilus assembly protein TadG